MKQRIVDAPLNREGLRKNLAICWNIRPCFYKRHGVSNFIRKKNLGLLAIFVYYSGMSSKNVPSADNQQESFQGLGYYIAGFVDGEGSFNVSLRRKNDYRIGWQIVLSFNISQKDLTVLRIIKNTLNCGIIKTRKCDGLYSYDVTKPKDIITKVIPYFDAFRFLSSSKQRNYELFKEISFIANKKPLNSQSFYEILKIREKLNEGRGRKRKYSIEDVFGKSSETIRQVSRESENDIVRPVWRHTESHRNVGTLPL